MVCDHLRLTYESEDVLIFPVGLSVHWLGYVRTAGESECYSRQGQILVFRHGAHAGAGAHRASDSMDRALLFQC
jgi:hypothetical protein